MKEVLRNRIIVCAVIFLIAIIGASFLCPDDPVIVKVPVIGFSMDTLDEERWISDKDYFSKRIEALGGVPIVTVADSNDEKQIEQIKSLINQKVDVIVVVPHNYEKLGTVLSEAHQAGIKVISYSRLINSTDVDFHISFSSLQIGLLEGEGIGNVTGKIAYLGGSSTDSNSILLRKGAMSAIGKRLSDGKIEIVFDEFIDEWDSQLAYEKLKDYLVNHKVDGVIAANDGLARGAIKALEEANLTNVPVSGGDADLLSCQYIVEGRQSSTVYMPIKKLANKAAEIAIQFATEQEISPNSITSKEGNLSIYLVNSVFVNKENINETIIKDGFHSYNEIYKL